uniref:Uncharacterized protein n=1 Tax=Rattus norvegicus TaxID=10116 RepID=A0ABK0L8A5_RAT
ACFLFKICSKVIKYQPELVIRLKS